MPTSPWEARTEVLPLNANCFQGMGCDRARSRGGRAAAYPAQGRDPRGEQALRDRARPLLPLPHLRSPAQRPRPRVAHARARARPRGGRLAGRRAARQGTAAGRRHPPARPCADPRMGRGGRQLPDHRPARRRRAVAVLHLDHRLRREAAGVEAAPPDARDPAAHLQDPATGDREGARPSTWAAGPGSSCTASSRSRAPPCSPTRSSSAWRAEIEAIASDAAVPALA